MSLLRASWQRHDWLILALPEDPRKLRVKVALHNSGILKKKALNRGLLCLAIAKALLSSFLAGGIEVSMFQDFVEGRQEPSPSTEFYGCFRASYP
eukprot:s981_g13.t1